MSWEFHNETEMYAHLVGTFYGPNPEEKRAKISSSRRKIARVIAHCLNLQNTQTVIDLGSGTGEMAHAISPLVKHLHCMDISESFLGVAKVSCKQLKNVSFHFLDSFKIDFIEGQSIDAIYSHAVFIHLNFYDFLLYFKTFARLLKPRGRVCLDFLSTDHIHFRTSSLIREHIDHYELDRRALPKLVHYHSERSIIKMATEFGFAVVFKYRGKEGSVLLVLEKSDGAPDRTFYLRRFMYLTRVVFNFVFR